MHVKTDGKMKAQIKKLAVYIPLALAFLALAFSLCTFLVTNRWQRRVIYFYQYGSDSVYSEVHLLPKTKNQQEAVRVFAEELLLGSVTNRSVPLFNRDTTLEFCIVNDKTAYIGLSKKALFFSEQTADNKTGISMLKRNIVSNFTSIDNVEVYIDSIAAD